MSEMLELTCAPAFAVVAADPILLSGDLHFDTCQRLSIVEAGGIRPSPLSGVPCTRAGDAERFREAVAGAESGMDDGLSESLDRPPRVPAVDATQRLRDPLPEGPFGDRELVMGRAQLMDGRFDRSKLVLNEVRLRLVRTRRVRRDEVPNPMPSSDQPLVS